MRVRLPPKNMNQGIYWVSTYLKYNLDKPPKVAKPTKQQEYRQLLNEILAEYTCEEYPQDIQDHIDEIHRILGLKTITKKHLEKVSNTIDILVEKYK
jgi:hypothetical protein